MVRKDVIWRCYEGPRVVGYMDVPDAPKPEHRRPENVHYGRIAVENCLQLVNEHRRHGDGTVTSMAPIDRFMSAAYAVAAAIGDGVVDKTLVDEITRSFIKYNGMRFFTTGSLDE